MNENKIPAKSVVAKNSLVLHETMWNSVIRRSKKAVLEREVFGDDYLQYLYEGSRAMANKMKERASEAHMKVEKEELSKTQYLKFNEFIEKFKIVEQSVDNLKTESMAIGANQTSGDKKNLTRRKQDEYKAELRQFIADKQKQRMVLDEAECEQRRLERLKIASDLKEQLKNEQNLLAKRRADRRIMESESMQISQKSRQRSD